MRLDSRLGFAEWRHSSSRLPAARDGLRPQDWAAGPSWRNEWGRTWKNGWAGLVDLVIVVFLGCVEGIDDLADGD